MKAHVNYDKTEEERNRVEAIKANAEAYFDNMMLKNMENEQAGDDFLRYFLEQKKISDANEAAYMAEYNAKRAAGWVDDTPIIECPTVEDFERRCVEADHVEEYIDETKFPPYDPSCGKTYEQYMADMIDQAESDMVFIQRYGTSGEVISEILKRPDDVIWENNPQSNTGPVLPISVPPVPETRENCPFNLDDDAPDPDLTEDEGMVTADKLPPDVQRSIAGGNQFINKHFVEERNRINNMANFGLNSTLFGSTTQASPTTNMYGMPQNQMYCQPNPYMMPQGNTFQFGNMASGYGYNNPYMQYQAPSQPNTNSIYEIREDGNVVRKLTPYFSVVPGGNKYQRVFNFVYNNPDHPEYENIKEMYRKEEYKIINTEIAFRAWSRPAGVDKDEYKKELRAIFDPYSVEFAKREMEIQEDLEEQKQKRLEEQNKCIMTTFTCHVKIKNAETGEVILDANPVREEYDELEAERKWLEDDRQRRASRIQHQQYLQNFYNALYQRRQEIMRRCPDFNDVSVEDFFSGKSDLSQRLYDIQVKEPEERMKKRRTIADFDIDNYCRQFGITARYRMDNHCTAGEEIIRQCGLKPGDPLYDYYMKDTERANYIAMNYYNPDGSPKHDARYDAKWKAYQLALQYPSNNITPGKPTNSVPPEVAATLPDDVLVELGLKREPVKGRA